MIRTAEAPVSENVEAAQLRAFVERIERVEDRLDYALEHFDRCRGISVGTMSRAYRLCAEIFSTNYETAKHIVWSKRPNLIKPINIGCVGFVYWASSDEDLGRVKIGFSRDLERRAKELSRLCGTPMKIRRFHAGTMLEEHAVHCEKRSARITGEWFRAEAA